VLTECKSRRTNGCRCEAQKRRAPLSGCGNLNSWGRGRGNTLHSRRCCCAINGHIVSGRGKLRENRSTGKRHQFSTVAAGEQVHHYEEPRWFITGNLEIRTRRSEDLVPRASRSWGTGHEMSLIDEQNSKSGWMACEWGDGSVCNHLHPRGPGPRADSKFFHRHHFDPAALLLRYAKQLHYT
jgi:hypothetical protein